MGRAATVNLDGRRFHCAACDQDAEFEHFDLQGVSLAQTIPLPSDWAMARCGECEALILLYEGEPVIPPQLFGDFDRSGLPPEIADEIHCAQATLRGSRRASAAHSRAALYAMLRDAAPRVGADTTLPITELVAQVVPRDATAVHAMFHDNCLREGTLASAGVHDTQDPPSTAFALLELLRMVKALLYP